MTTSAENTVQPTTAGGPTAVPESAGLAVVTDALAKHTGTDRELITPGLRVAEVPGIESVRLLRVLSHIEDVCAVTVPEDFPFESATVQDLADHIEQQTKAREGGDGS
jgi:acyl carrier protein